MYHVWSIWLKAISEEFPVIECLLCGKCIDMYLYTNQFTTVCKSIPRPWWTVLSDIVCHVCKIAILVCYMPHSAGCHTPCSVVYHTDYCAPYSATCCCCVPYCAPYICHIVCYSVHNMLSAIVHAMRLPYCVS